jgi:hypothetical protein
MLAGAADNTITFCELVEYGDSEFPQYHKYGVADDGSVYYSTNTPECSGDTYSDEDDPDEYLAVRTRAEALQKLQSERRELQHALETLDRLVAAFEKPVEFVVYWADEALDE